MNGSDLQAALDAGGTVVIDGVVRLDRSLVVSVPVRIEGGLLLGAADVVLLDVCAATTIVGTGLVRSGGFGHVIRTNSALKLDTVSVSGARNWAWEAHRRPPVPQEWHGAGVHVSPEGSLIASALTVTGCTGIGVSAGGDVRWTRGSASSCRWGLWTGSGAVVVREVSFVGNGAGIEQVGEGSVTAVRCRYRANAVGVAASGPGRVEVRGGSARENSENGVCARMLADVQIDGVAFLKPRGTEISATGWSDVIETGCTFKGGDGPPINIEDVARVATSLPAKTWSLDLRAALRGNLDRCFGPDRAEIVRRSLDRSDTVEDLRRFEVLVGRWGARGLAWLDDGQREVLWTADLPGPKHRILRDPAGRVWLLSDAALVTDGVRIEPGGSHVAIGEVIALADRREVRLYELDGAPITTAPPMTETGPIYRVDVVGRREVQVHRVVGNGPDQHARQFTWNVADAAWTSEYTNTPSEPLPCIEQVLQDAPWLGVTTEFAKQAWCDGDLGAIALACDMAVVVKRL